VAVSLTPQSIVVVVSAQWAFSIFELNIITKLSSNEIFSPSNKIHREVGGAKNLSAPLHIASCPTKLNLSFGALFCELRYTEWPPMTWNLWLSETCGTNLIKVLTNATGQNEPLMVGLGQILSIFFPSFFLNLYRFRSHFT